MSNALRHWARYADDYHDDDDGIDANDDRDRYCVNRLTALQTISIDFCMF